jgi:membrane fusion protein (multidrug efflux system)
MAALNERETKASRRVVRVVVGLTLAASFTVGIVALMMVLAGAFEPKVKPEPARGEVAAAAGPASRDFGDVRLVRRPRRESAVGTVRPVYEAVIASKILARVEEVRVKAGQEVKQGEVLVVLDQADLKSRLEQEVAAEAAARVRSELAETELARFRRLKVGEAVSERELDQLGAAVRGAKAELERARRAVEEARIVQSYASICAPISGRVIDKKVNAGDTVSPGQVLVTMYDPTHMQMVATVRESLALRLKIGQEIPAKLETLGNECNATVSEIVPEAQAESRSFQVKLTGPCPPNVYSGMFGRVFIPLDDEDVLVVPPGAIRRVGQLDEVDVVEGDRVIRRAVQLGRALDEGREVLSGLKEGEKVVILKGGRGQARGGRS